MAGQWEFWFVDDGSKAGTLAEFRALRAQDERVHFISFSRNFGKESAMYAGLEAATGDYVAIMDVDLQDPPELLPGMLQSIEEEGYDCVATRRVTRKGEPPIRSFFARQFYRLINRISKTEIVDGARDFRLMTRQMVDSILSLKEVSRFSKGIFSWVGYRTKWLEYENVAIASITGVVFCGVSILLLLYFFIKTLIWGDPVAGFPAMICIILFLGGIQLFCVGILGQYLSKTYLETKRRPIYIAREKE